MRLTFQIKSLARPKHPEGGDIQQINWWNLPESTQGRFNLMSILLYQPSLDTFFLSRDSKAIYKTKTQECKGILHWNTLKEP